ncbi:TetR/AcrR family transcriptional regulator [Agromyces protaetiae]|uniref:TetR/AcrR family transcriptional regulator n=1 Tax=Agromyces protaetiae TaxID=2509455 RepID=A0A4P6FB93_9MICO|nr:TetR/AcrR family transcriptional regulator [Agromyces protaetiae]QAY73252.1 TetR/AcrR family transcriptional regulator [Agromyces protaetiae]
MPKVSDAHRAARRAEIVDAAVRCFAERGGYARTSIADLIQSSGLSAGAIYGHFPGGKKELFAAAATRVLDARAIELDARRGDAGPLDPGRIVATLVDGIRREPFSGVIVQLWAEAATDDEIRGLVRAVFSRLRDTVEAHLAEWGTLHPDRIDGDVRTWAARIAPVVLGAAPGSSSSAPSSTTSTNRPTSTRSPSRSCTDSRSRTERGRVGALAGSHETHRADVPWDTRSMEAARAEPPGSTGRAQIPCHTGLFAHAYR